MRCCCYKSIFQSTVCSVDITFYLGVFSRNSKCFLVNVVEIIWDESEAILQILRQRLPELSHALVSAHTLFLLFPICSTIRLLLGVWRFIKWNSSHPKLKAHFQLNSNFCNWFSINNFPINESRSEPNLIYNENSRAYSSRAVGSAADVYHEHWHISTAIGMWRLWCGGGQRNGKSMFSTH